MLKTIGSPDRPVSKKNDDSRPASRRNDGSRPAFGKNEGDGEIVGFCIDSSGGKPLHCWIRLDHPRCQSLERWGSTTMKLLAVVVTVH